MPKAGIHKWRSTSWNSGEPGLNNAQMASVTPNAAMEMMSVSHRIRAVRRPSALPMTSTSSAPTTGRSHEIESSGRLIRDWLLPAGYRLPEPEARSPKGSPPQVVPQNHDDADKERPGIRTH